MRGQDDEAFKERGDQADDDTFRKHRDEFPSCTPYQQKRRESRDGGEDGGHDGPEHFIRAVDHGAT